MLGSRMVEGLAVMVVVKGVVVVQGWLGLGLVGVQGWWCLGW